MVLTIAQWVPLFPITHTLHLLTLLVGRGGTLPQSACSVIRGGSGARFIEICRTVIKIEI